jgi:uncharacterized SAM-binding protein YcdF (DUF218 family)
VRTGTNTSFRSYPRKKQKRFRKLRLAARIIIYLCLLAVIWCGYALWLINSYEDPPGETKAEAGIVLGAALWNDKPSPGLQERLDHALRLYADGRIARFIVTGGLDYNGSTLTEAEGMRNYLTAHGVPEEMILLEQKARSTYENLLFSQAIMQTESITDVIIITHDYHAARAKEVAAYVGIDHAVMSAAHSKVLNISYNQSREVLAFTKWKLDAVLLRFGLRSPDATY